MRRRWRDADERELVGALLLETRNVAEFPLIVRRLVTAARRQPDAASARANAFGKASTLLQFTTASAALFGAPWTGVPLARTAVVGACAGARYFRRDV